LKQPDTGSSLESQASFRPKKSFGQNFLVQRSAIQGIIQAALASKAERLIEIGPGKGVLTAPLLEDGRPLWAVELDIEACDHLQERFGHLTHFHLLHGDAVRIALPEGGQCCVVGNLPYNAATAILGRFLLEPIPWERLVFMFQLEVAQKILGKPGEKSYGPISVIAQVSCGLTRLMKLGPSAFNPPPKVDSAVILFERRSGAPDPQSLRQLQRLLFRGFAHRRKTLANNWQGWLPSELIQEILMAAGLPPTIRAEAIAPQGWLTIKKLVETLAPGVLDTDALS
jgi:16S rRNA (adenine1518-N6/adenine1519-N6)-dimethyltransferase